MTLKRLMIILGILVVLAGGGIMWLWPYAYSPQGRARNILEELRGGGTLRGWLIAHGVKRQPPPPARVEKWAHVDGSPLSPRELQAERELVALGPDALPALFEAFSDSDPYRKDRLVAIVACGDLHDERAVGPLTEGLARETSNLWVRQWFTEALGETRSPKAVPALLAEFATGSREERVQAVGHLAACWGNQAIPTLVQALGDKEESVRYQAVSELGRLKDPRAVAPLAECLANPKNRSLVAYGAITALESIGDRRAIPPLLKATEEKDLHFRLRAAGALAKLHEQKGFDILLAALWDKNATGAQERDFVVYSLGTSGDQRAVGPIMELAGDENAQVRSSVADALGKLGDAKALPVLRQMLGDSDRMVRLNAESALKRLSAAQPAKKSGE